MKLFHSLIFFLIFTLLFSCRHPQSTDTEFSGQETQNQEVGEHFRIYKKDNYLLLTVKNPYVGSEVEEKYVLYQRGTQPPKLKGITHFIPVPVQKVAINSTTHLGFLAALNLEDRVSGATNLDLYYHASFKQMVREKTVRSIGKAEIEAELLLNNPAELLFSYTIDVKDLKEVQRLRDLGQKVVLISEYMEADPLKKAAWIRFMARFFEAKKWEEADRFYKKIKGEYQKLQKKAQSHEYSPSVMIGFPWKGSWFVSGGDSFQAQLIKDAHANYLWADQVQKGGVPLSTEQVLNRAIKAKYWINPGSAKSLSEMLERQPLVKQFDAFQAGEVFHPYKRSNSNGANDYWERGIVRPDLILADLIQIFHPDAKLNRELYFYQKLLP